MTAAAPRKKVKGDWSMRPQRMGISSGARPLFEASRRTRGSGRLRACVHSPWLRRGQRSRRLLPFARISLRVGMIVRRDFSVASGVWGLKMFMVSLDWTTRDHVAVSPSPRHASATSWAHGLHRAHERAAVPDPRRGRHPDGRRPRASLEIALSSRQAEASIAWRRDTLQLLQALERLDCAQRVVVDASGVEAAPLLEGKLGKSEDEHLELLLDGDEEPDVVRVPADVHAGLTRRALIGVRAKVDDHRPARDVADGGSDVADLRGKVDLPVVPANGVQLAALTEVEDLLARPLLDLALEEGQEIVAVGVHLEGLAVRRIALLQLRHNVRLACGGEEGGHPIFLREDLVDDGAGLDHARPSHEHGHAEATLPRGALLALVRGGASVGPRDHLGAIVGAVDHDGVVGDAEVVELLEDGAHHLVVLDHAIGVEADAGTTLGRRLQMRPDVHPRGVEPDEEGLARLRGLVHEDGLRGEDLLVDGRHAGAGERAGVVDLLAALAVGPGVENAAGPVLLPKLRILGVVVALRLLLGVEVIEVAEELVEAVHGRQVLVAVAEVVLAELAGDVALLFEQIGDGGRPGRDALRRAGHADGEETRAEGMMAEDERRAAGRAALLRVGIGEERTLAGDAIDVRGAVAHHAEAVGADVVDADVVTPNHENVGLPVRRSRGAGGEKRDAHQQGVEPEWPERGGLHGVSSESAMRGREIHSRRLSNLAWRGSAPLEARDGR